MIILNPLSSNHLLHGLGVSGSPVPAPDGLDGGCLRLVVITKNKTPGYSWRKPGVSAWFVQPRYIT
jgi:hypothetical protein